MGYVILIDNAELIQTYAKGTDTVAMENLKL